MVTWDPSRKVPRQKYDVELCCERCFNLSIVQHVVRNVFLDTLGTHFFVIVCRFGLQVGVQRRRILLFDFWHICSEVDFLTI